MRPPFMSGSAREGKNRFAFRPLEPDHDSMPHLIGAVSDEVLRSSRRKTGVGRSDINQPRFAPAAPARDRSMSEKCTQPASKPVSGGHFLHERR